MNLKVSHSRACKSISITEVGDCNRFFFSRGKIDYRLRAPSRWHRTFTMEKTTRPPPPPPTPPRPIVVGRPSPQKRRRRRGGARGGRQTHRSRRIFWPTSSSGGTDHARAHRCAAAAGSAGHIDLTRDRRRRRAEKTIVREDVTRWSVRDGGPEAREVVCRS